MSETPLIQAGKRKRPDEVQNVSRKARRTRNGADSGMSSTEQQDDREKASSKHSKKERKRNRSSRIHSLRKLLAREGLPGTVRQEKERELTALIHEQNKEKLKKDARKTLEKYHYVRFVERQKAEKRLKQLRKQLQAGGNDDSLAKQIHEMEVNRNYAMYAPLHEKYLSIFVSNAHDSNGDAASSRPTRPEMWYVVEEAMLQGQAALEALREGRSRNAQPQSMKAGAEDGLESKSLAADRRSKGTKKDLRGAAGAGSDGAQGEASEDHMSDGGFFER